MHVARIRSGHTDKAGQRREYESAYLRRTYRDGGRVRHETLANLSGLPDQVVGSIEAALQGTALVPAGRRGDDHPVSAARPRRRRARDGRQARAARDARPGLPAPGPGAGPGHLPGRGPGLQAIHPDLAGGHDARRGPGHRGGVCRRRVRGDGLAGGQAGRDRGEAGPPSPGPGGQPAEDGAVRPVLLVDGGPVLPAVGPRLLPRRQEGQAADRVRAAHRPRGPPGRGPGLPRQHRRPGRVHRDRAGGAGQVRAGEDGHGRGPGHDHHCPHRRPERSRRGLLVDHRAARPRDPQAHGRRRPAAAVPVR